MRDGWALAIGRFIVAFAGCEYWTYLFVRTYGTAAEREAINKQLLRERLTVLGKVVLRMHLTPEMQQQVNAATKRFRRLVPTRNILAHNAPMVRVYVHEVTGKFEVKHELRCARDSSKGLTAERIEQEAAEAEKIEEEFALLYGQVRKPESRSRTPRGQ